MDKVKFFAIFIPVLIGLAYLFRILIPIVIASIAICIITLVLFGKNNGLVRRFQSREPTTFVCVECGYYHNEIACPKCGSKIKKYYTKS